METVNKKELIAATLITVLIAFMDISGLPASLFLNINIADITSYYFTVMVNFVLIALVCFLLVRAFCPGWEFGLQTGNIASGLKKYGLPGIAATLLSLVAFWYGLYATSSFDYSPTIIKVLIEGFVYYIGVAFIEELYVRGLLQNIIEKSLGGKKALP
jgi:membrane protease YdiL (CAAX protease family)